VGDGFLNLLYYDDGQCVAGQCTWQVHTMPCRMGCQLGACVIYLSTAQ
jgi:hypothetical protein